MTEETKKTKKTKKKVVTDEERIAKARKRRLALAKEKAPVTEKTDDREDFRKFFIKINKKLKIDKSLEEAIWIHLKTIKHNKKELFEDGIKHFGYNI